jgi:hypothetical protein
MKVITQSILSLETLINRLMSNAISVGVDNAYKSEMCALIGQFILTKHDHVVNAYNFTDL